MLCGASVDCVLLLLTYSIDTAFDMKKEKLTAVLEDDSTLSVYSSQLWKHTDVVESLLDTIQFQFYQLEGFLPSITLFTLSNQFNE